MCRQVTFLALVLSFQFVSAQQGLPDKFTDDFAFSVQTVDDFFDRFDYERGTPFFNYVEINYPGLSLDRKKVMVSLFEARQTIWEADLVNRFLARFGTNYAPRLRFSQNNWYAMLHCKVMYQRKRRKLDLILKAESVIASSGTIGFKWSLVSAKANFLLRNDTLEYPDTFLTRPVITEEGKFLHPMSHAINFMNIQDVFRKGLTRSYFAMKSNSQALDTLEKLINTSQIRFLQVDSVNYQLLQLPGWIVTLGFYDREDRNSGWLIQQLQPADERMKREFLKEQLNIR